MPKLLIVDDDEFIRNGLKHLIDWDELGIEIIGEAEGGHEAYRIFLESTPQIVLTDIRMPDGDGLELISRIREKGWNTHIIVLSGYDDFSFVRQAMRYQVEDYLLKPVDANELIEIAKSCCEELEKDWMSEQIQRESFQLLRNNVFIRWVENRIDFDLLREKLDFLDVRIGHNRLYQVAVIAWKDMKETHLTEAECNFRSFAILNSMEEIITKEQRGVAFLNQDQYIVCIMIGEKQDPRQFAINNLEWMKRTSESYAAILKTPWFCTMGMPVQQSNSLHTSYRDALRLLDIIEWSGDVKCIDRDEATLHIAKPIPDIANREKIVPSIIAGHRDLWSELLNQSFQWAISHPEPLTAAKYVAAEWLAIVKETIRQIKTGLDHPFSGNLIISDLFDIATVSMIRQKVYDTVLELEQIIQQNKTRRKNIIIEEVEKYLQEHYDQELSLQILAEKFHVSSIYLGRLFKSETGEYFSDYLNRLRIEEAKRLLHDSYLKTTEIAIQVGFLDPNYFYRKFKQTVGISPTEFRNSAETYI
jgi:two-component system response regulator YesN